MNSTFKREERLKSNTLIQELLQQGKTVSAFPFKIYWKLSNDPVQEHPVRIAIAVPRKRFSRAVDRNLIKRRTRESYRKNKTFLYESLSDSRLKLIMLIIYITDDFMPHKEIESALRTALTKLVKNLEQ